MKKIIATVLAMVMAMALCVTAFATNYSDGYYFANGKWNKIDLTKVSVSYTNPSETKTDGKVVSAKIGYYTLKETGKNDVVLVEVAQDDATYQIKADSTVKYLTTSNGNQDQAYTLTGTELTSSTDCGKVSFQGTMYTAGGKYYVENSASSTYMLIDGQVVAVTETSVTVNQHDFQIKTKATDANGVVSGTAKCSKCPQTATLTSKMSLVPKGAESKTVSVDGKTCYLYWTESTSGSASTNGSANSPKTFDAGVAMYAGMALMSVAGSAVVIGKKKEF